MQKETGTFVSKGRVIFMTETDFVLLQKSVFTGITTDEISSMLSCLSARETTFQKDEIIFSYGQHITSIGIVLEGNVHIIKEDFWGNANLLAECCAGDIFGEAYAINTSEPLEMNIFAASRCRILFLEVSKILSVCSSACEFHNRLIQNLLTLVSKKNFQLNRKLEHMSKRTTREKLLSYLSMESKKAGTSSFTISFNRQQLADYLSVDRSAMSNELCKLRDEGILKFQKNHFTLFEGDRL